MNFIPKKMIISSKFYISTSIAAISLFVIFQEAVSRELLPVEHSKWTEWRRPVDQPIFTADYGNNHDSIIFVDSGQEYPYHLIISHRPKAAHLWRAKKFSWSSSNWELVSDNYQIGKQYEYDDGIKVDGTYYIYESGKVYTYSGALEDGNGKWKISGTFPHKQCDDVGVYVENGIFHLFGEYGYFPEGPDGTSLSHFTSTTGLGDWKLVNPRAVDPNPDGGHKYGIGDPTIAKIEGDYYIFCDLESKQAPYRVVAWKARDLNEPFKYLGVAIEPRSSETDDWDNYRVQDPDITYIPELNSYIMTCNMMDKDGDPGGNFPTVRGEYWNLIGSLFPRLKSKWTRVIGSFYSIKVQQKTTAKTPLNQSGK